MEGTHFIVHRQNHGYTETQEKETDDHHGKGRVTDECNVANNHEASRYHVCFGSAVDALYCLDRWSCRYEANGICDED
jgi:hypothetical protein